CRELATLQQWIVAGVVTRESLISRSGKTWKRLGDIAELGQYFVVADEAKAKRARQPTPKPLPVATMRRVPPAVGAPIAEDEQRTPGPSRARVPSNQAAPSPAASPPRANPMAQTELSPTLSEAPTTRRPPTQPPPVPARTVKAPSGPPPAGERQTAA